MRARMSGGARRQTPIIDGFTSDREAFACYALAEARSILADAEPTDPMWSAHLTARGILPWNERLALAESLRSFVEGD